MRSRHRRTGSPSTSTRTPSGPPPAGLRRQVLEIPARVGHDCTIRIRRPEPPMNKPTRSTSTNVKLTTLPPTQVVRLRNVSCVYCGLELTKQTRTKEHVIGRRFVPKGKLDRSWNIVLNACRTCNEFKANLEDDISAITMLPDSFGSFGHDDAGAISDAARKASNSISRRTRKPVIHSQERMKLNMPFMRGGSLSVELTSPPQADHHRLLLLARMQLMGFFFWITHKHDARQGYCWPGGYYPFVHANRTDWGNSMLTGFAQEVADWWPRVMATNADGFYKIALKRHPQTECWSWALQWNHALRLVGFLGEEVFAKQLISKFPKPEMKIISCTNSTTLRYRTETPLPDDHEDILFQ